MPASVKLGIGAVVVVGVTTYMAYVGASSSWKYYLSIDECLADTEKFVGQRLRVSGKVAPDSLLIDARRTQASFALVGTRGKLEVNCSGPLPDNLAEGIDVVVEGRLESGRLRGHKVLTRCASKYEAGGPVKAGHGSLAADTENLSQKGRGDLRSGVSAGSETRAERRSPTAGTKEAP